MNNLLKTLTSSHVKSSLPESELRLLLSAVKETRRACNDPAKLADAFYDSLEGLLQDLRMVTMDNRDAEAFLKPVARSEVPDYLDIISTPMDLGTMLRKVKQRQYKSKKEFKDDLDLIWSNCFTYNATEDHPLRLCASRLQIKADRLLKHITDFKERTDPIIPGEVPTRGVARVNGITTNGVGRHLSGAAFRSPSPTKQPIVVPGQTKKIPRDSSLPESLAFVRTQAGMSAFLQLDHDFDEYISRDPDVNLMEPSVQRLKERLIQYASTIEDGKELSLFGDGEVGMKRKLNGFVDDRPRKRVRTQNVADKNMIELYWDAMRSDEMLTSGVPSLTYVTSVASTSMATPSIVKDTPRKAGRRKKKKQDVPAPDTLLYHMNNNVRTLRRVRTTHAKFTALQQSLEDGNGLSAPPINDIPDDVDDVMDELPWKPVGRGIEMGEEHANDCLHWMGRKVLEHAGFQGTSKMALDVLSSVMAEYMHNVGRTMRFLCDKYGNQMTAEEIILHTLFESGITEVSDLERYVKDDIIRYGGRLNELEKKLTNAYSEATTEEAWDDEALFRMEGDEEEGGNEFVMGNFADSFGDDFFGLKELGIADEFGLSSLTVPKRLLKGRKAGLKEGPSIAKPTEPPPPFPPPPPFVLLDSNSVDDQIGLLRSFYQSRVSEISTSVVAAPPVSSLPPPLAPPGMPFAPLHPGSLAPIPALAPPSFMSVNPTSAEAAGPSEPPVNIIIPDDAASPSHAKIGPLGTINKATPAASTAKKKKAKPPVAPDGAGDGDAGPTAGGGGGDVRPPMTPALAAALPPPMMSASSTGNGSAGGDGPKKSKGTPSKKKAKVDPFPPVVMASA
ncbi:uncharacterized protein BXZ73DRAFT_100523 [Epithele typhae]|uniref:uncharacterized protein n=1 Tax=Epithele typhae TaxID=378194 RepID=UPI0020085486|nr:uncharacterized protein BXZ73DRAFT_100523 [Epithele typhae]KAH9935133.1 hypothetical protein BXZ73DRAFT_100523 [Epithele typhae]